MLNFLVLIGVVLLLVIAVQLAAIGSRQRAMNKWIAGLLLPKDFPFHEDMADEADHRSVLDQLGLMVAQLNQRTDNVDGMLRYLRNYVWEVVDHRYIDDIRNPPQSYEWGRSFRPNDDPADYGLWRRERDMSEGFNREVAMTAAKRRSENEPKSKPDEADSE